MAEVARVRDLSRLPRFSGCTAGTVAAPRAIGLRAELAIGDVFGWARVVLGGCVITGYLVMLENSASFFRLQ